ncbi:MAG TPA: PPC domain-containing protein [Pyrinomonadaceae bacterium]|nr:PPC domain-containing protein [Pyrinomonadaceae bacterium]
MKSGETQTFTVTLDEDTFLQLAVEQRGIDVVVRINSPEGKTIGEFDTPNGNQGVEDVSFVATTTGSYAVTIFPLSNPATASVNGRYQIKILDCRPATSDELKALKNIEVNALKSKALLKDLVVSVTQLKTSALKVRYQLTVASVVEQADKTLSKQMLDGAISTFTELAAPLNEEDDDYSLEQYSFIGQLRNEILESIAPRDPEKALEFLSSSRNQMDRLGQGQSLDIDREVALKLLVASQLAKSEPKRTYQMAQEILKDKYANGLAATLESLKSKSPDLAEQLESQMVQKLSAETLLQNAEAAQLATTLLQSYSGEQTALLSVDGRNKLFQKLLTESLAYKPTTDARNFQTRSVLWNVLETLKSVGPSIDSTQSAAVEKKFAEVREKWNPQDQMMQRLQEQLNNSSVEQSLERIEKAPDEIREQMYQSVAEKVAAAGDIDKAQLILNAHITDLYQRRQLVRSLEQQRAFQLAAKGNPEEALRIIRAIPSAKLRSSMIAQIAPQLGRGLKRSAVLNVLEQARSILGSSTKAANPEEMTALLELGKAFTKYDPNRATEIIQPLLDQFNDLDAAFRTIRNFAQLDVATDSYFQGGEFNGNIGPQMPSVIGQLATKDFDRAKALADRINSSEVRITVYIEMVRTTLPVTPQD